ncbi:MAG: transporter substrate-binding domain-containing protein [Solobacterium sp.]|nr:transporter substrate-binding domain-containing protein [Solobacterium sp.]
MRIREFIKRISLITLFFAVMIGIAMPLPARAEGPADQPIRVGWFDSSFCYWDSFGRRCGIAYEYMHRISAYTGWTYEYVEDSWPNLFEMLEQGKIDVLCDVSYKPEREEYISFPDLPMGSESYYIYVDDENRTLTADNLSSFNGTRIGVNQGSIQEGFLRDWAEKNHVSITVLPMTEDEDESMDMVTRGEIDGYASIYTFSSEQKVLPVVRIGSSEYYCAVNKKRPDILAEMNMALAGIQDEDPFFNQRLTEERLYNTRTNAFLTPTQEDWLAGKDSLKVGYRDHFLPFCTSDEKTKELTGALKDYLAHASNNLRNTEIEVIPVPYASVQEALDALKREEIDCVFPVYLSSYDADQMDIRLTNPAMTTEINAMVRNNETLSLSRDSKVKFAVNGSDSNVMTFIMDQYPSSSWDSYASDEECFAAVSSGKADCVLISNYRVPLAEEMMNRYKLFSIPSSESIPLSFAVRADERELYFLLNKTVLMTRSEEMASALASYMSSGRKVSFSDFMKDNWLLLVGVLTVVFAVILVLLLQRLTAERKLNEQQKLMEDGLRRELDQKEQLQSAMEMAYRDPLTGVKSKHAFNEAEERMDRRISGGEVSQFSVVVFDLNDLKTINDSKGHEAGDEYIKEACKLICTSFKHSPVFRIGGDEFTAVLEGEDFTNQEELLEKFEKQVLVNLEKDKAVVAFGCSKFDPRQDKTFRSVFERADALMYKEKMLLKSLGAAKHSGEEEDKSFAIEDIAAVNLRKRIMIADDIESNREILGDLLEDEYDVIYASDGVEALEILRENKHDIALLILDLYMPNLSGRDVMAAMQVDEDLMTIPIVVLTVDQNAELDCLKMGAMDFIPKPYPDIEIVRARISKCIELSENRDLIRRTQRDKLTGLYNIDYFLRYVNRYDQYYKDKAFDALACDVNHFYSVNEQYGRQFGDLVLRSIGISLNKLARKTGGIGCRKEGDTFLLYCPHQDDWNEILEKFMAELFVEKDTSEKVTLRFGIYPDAQQEEDIEERFVRAKTAADSVEDHPDRNWGTAVVS